VDSPQRLEVVRDPYPGLLFTSRTCPQPKRPSLSGTAQNWPGRRFAFDFGVNGYSFHVPAERVRQAGR